MNQKLFLSILMLLGASHVLEASQSIGNQPRISTCIKITQSVKGMFSSLHTKCKKAKVSLSDSSVGRMGIKVYSNAIAKPATYIWNKIAGNNLDVQALDAVRKISQTLAYPAMLLSTNNISTGIFLGSGLFHLFPYLKGMSSRKFLQNCLQSNRVMIVAYITFNGVIYLIPLLLGASDEEMGKSISNMLFELLCSHVGLEALAYKTMDNYEYIGKKIFNFNRPEWRFFWPFEPLIKCGELIAGYDNMLSRDGNGYNPAMIAHYEVNTTPLIMATKKGRTIGLQGLLFVGANPNRKDVNGKTALHHAIINHNAEAAFQLTVAGANLAICDAKGKSSLNLLAEMNLAGGNQTKRFIEKLKLLYLAYRKQIVNEYPELERYLPYDIRLIIAEYLNGIPKLV